MTPDMILYTAHANATGGRDGRAVSSDKVLVTGSVGIGPNRGARQASKR